MSDPEAQSSDRPFASFLSILRRSTDLLTEDPVRDELFSIERLELYASHLAHQLQVSPDSRRGRSVIPGLERSGAKLLENYNALTAAIRDKQAVSPAAEWFVDNFHIIEDQLRSIKRDLPRNYYSELPKLAAGELQGFPQVYALSMAIIAHTDSRLDAETLRRFIQAYQRVSPLQIGEVWAVAITLRITLLEHLTPLTTSIVSARINREAADILADRLLELAVRPETEPHELVQLLSSELGSAEDYDRAFIVQLVQRLRDQDPDVRPAFDWLEKQLQTHHDTHTQQVVQLELQSQASAQVSIGNIISSLRLLATLDWRDFFESVSLIDPILALDPAAVYSKMDFHTRDRYRHAVERIARRAIGDEIAVSHKAIELATDASRTAPEDERRSHVGYYLIGDGLKQLERFFRYRPRFMERGHRLILGSPTFFYLGSLSALTALFIALPLHALHWTIWVLAAFPASELALSLLNYYITFLIHPQVLPKMETAHGLPGDARTMVVIPTLFSSVSVVHDLLQSLEIHYLGNQDPALSFALLGDFSDADTETMPSDDVILAVARQGIDELNARHPARFHLFHRRRLWNQSEGKWIGWERKRGKLLEFNRLLRGASDTSYLGEPPDAAFLSAIKYVITLDSDTQLPRDAARLLVGTIVHPLNRPRYDAHKKRVTAGYGILQPRISVDLVSAARTRFAELYSGNTGLDPYTTAVSDVYQDLFAEGSFTGKGLYVVDAFELALADRVPENVVLSHDLFEGSYARSALVTDVELFDDYPSDYETFSKRAHRWTRGDWQIASWLFPWVSDAKGRLGQNPLTLISRWKIFDNLRRSVVPIATLLWLILGWTTLPGSPAVLTLPILVVLAFSIYAPILSGAVFRRGGLPWRGHALSGLRQTRVRLAQVILMIAFLPDQAWTQTDAILRTLYRKLISKKKLLEWMTFAQSRLKRRKATSFVEMIVPGPLFAVLVGGLVACVRAHALEIAAPFLLVWLAAPFLKRWVSRKSRREKLDLNRTEIRAYRRYARRTWHYFETFVGAGDHWLAPDNFQTDPEPIVAHRTSPTNIGLQLLATASAYDLGYLGCLEYLERLEKTFQTLHRLEKMEGHLFNWYDTLTLEPLRPRYVSTVDSGNLAGHLIALKQACRELAESPGPSPVSRTGLADTLHELLEEAGNVGSLAQNSGTLILRQFKESIQVCLEQVSPKNPPVGSESVLHWVDLLATLSTQLAECEDMLSGIAVEESPEKLADTRTWLLAAQRQVDEFARDLREFEDGAGPEIKRRFAALMAQIDEIVLGMNFRFLFDDERKLFVIGYSVTESRRDSSYYDLLASESRLASFIAIAKGDVPQEHWFRLGRKMAATETSRALIAWTATMFEYLMPLLVMRRYGNTLLDQTYDTVVARQIEYGREHGVPWGVSEAGYNARDLQLNFQYGPFGIPGLGLKRGLSDELVISPYSTMLAAMVDPHAALANLAALSEVKAFSKYGFFESIDYTTARLPAKQKSFILRSFMSHHQGMSLVAINNLINDSRMQRRFHADPLVQSADLLLQERVPRAVTLLRPRPEESQAYGTAAISLRPHPRHYTHYSPEMPRTQLLSNGSYSVMVTSAGSGYSRCGRLAMTRWREDLTRDHWGQYIYIRKRGTGRLWSSGFQPTLTVPEDYAVTFGEDKVEISRRDDEISTVTEITVSPEDNVELRQVTLTNHGSDPVEIEVTSYMETVLASPADDAAHPAFSNLFVQTEFAPTEDAILATRRRRSPTDKQPWGFHGIVTEGKALGPVQYETDRARFIGRGRDPSLPRVIDEDRPLTGTVGAVLDPIFSLRQTVRIPPGDTVRVLFATGIAESRADALRMADKYHDVHVFARASNLAWIQSRIQLRHLNIDVNQAHQFQRLAGRIIYSDPSLRPRSHLLGLNTKTQAALWAYGISGDYPIILTRISDERDMIMVRELLHGHEYLRLKGLTIDLVILNERAPSYLQSLQDELQRQIRMSGSQALLDKPGGIFMRRADILPAEDLTLLKTVARVVLSAEKGTLEEQLKRKNPVSELPKDLVPTASKRIYPERHSVPQALSFFNGTGGFSPEAREYVIVLKEGQWTPAPWVNVIANAHDFGFLISESGAGYTWSANSRENRLTSWSNDSVSDPVAEAIYIRDEETGEYWSPTPLPIREPETYLIRHGQGYTQFEHSSHGISQELHVSVSLDAGVKVSRLRLRNLGKSARRLSVMSYSEWVLGFQRGATAPTVVTEIDEQTGAIFARNPYNNEFAGRVAFAEMVAEGRGLTCDRREFLGRNGNPAHPAALRRETLSGASGAGLDPCAAFHAVFTLKPGQEIELVVLLGQAEDVETARALVKRYRRKEVVEAALVAVLAYWNKTLGAIEIKTPDVAMNTLVNRWLPYQALSCRIWARSGFYQSGGAIGFRDQLQDVMALVYSRPEIARQQILTAAARQFEQGDVQHWWHPPTGRGVRTHFSDDLLWLPFVTSFYVSVTGDSSVLQEPVSFIDAPELEPGLDDSYFQPRTSSEVATVLEHCARALDRSLKTGNHGLPLMGSGDWNDGMNRVGHLGKGESVWVGWFLHRTLSQFIPFSESAGQTERVVAYRKHLDVLKDAIEANAWDGAWYKRAFFDDGSSLGSATGDECQIDSIAQSWAVLSGAGDPKRARQAMEAVNERLVHRGDALVKLFTPPFDHGDADPGYIKGYVPGVRENGGQYTHAAIWALMAYAEQGDGDRAMELFSMINPIHHAATRAGVNRYKVEPYVIAADVYGLSPHVGRGGWSWYTGSASWMYRAALESILGFELRAGVFRFKPNLPKHWPGFEMLYCRGTTRWLISVKAEGGVPARPRPSLRLDGVQMASMEVPIVEDGVTHTVQIEL